MDIVHALLERRYRCLLVLPVDAVDDGVDDVVDAERDNAEQHLLDRARGEIPVLDLGDLRGEDAFVIDFSASPQSGKHALVEAAPVVYCRSAHFQSPVFCLFSDMSTRPTAKGCVTARNFALAFGPIISYLIPASRTWWRNFMRIAYFLKQETLTWSGAEEISQRSS